MKKNLFIVLIALVFFINSNKEINSIMIDEQNIRECIKAFFNQNKENKDVIKYDFKIDTDIEKNIIKKGENNRLEFGQWIIEIKTDKDYMISTSKKINDEIVTLIINTTIKKDQMIIKSWKIYSIKLPS